MDRYSLSETPGDPKDVAQAGVVTIAGASLVAVAVMLTGVESPGVIAAIVTAQVLGVITALVWPLAVAARRLR